MFSIETLFVAGILLAGALALTVLRALVTGSLREKVTPHDRWLYNEGTCYAWASMGPVLAWVLVSEHATTETWIGVLGAWLIGAAMLWVVPSWLAQRAPAVKSR